MEGRSRNAIPASAPRAQAPQSQLCGQRAMVAVRSPGRGQDDIGNKGLDMDGAFKDREKGYESKWAHDEELRFKVYARRNKLLGQWAASQLGLSGAEAEQYARAVVSADFEKPGEDDVFEKV